MSSGLDGVAVKDAQADSSHRSSGIMSIPHQKFRDVPLDYSRMFYMLYESLDTQIRLAESKANLVLGANAILIATSALDRGAVRNVLSQGGAELERLSVALSLLMLFGLIVSVFFALRTSFPTLRQPERADDPFFFLHIKQRTQSSFAQAFMELNGYQIKESVLAQIHAKSFIITRKFRFLRLSMLALFFALLMWIGSQVALALI